MIFRWLGLALVLLGGAEGLRAQEPPKKAVDPVPNKASVQVPYRLTNAQHIMVRAKINGKGPFNFILDTGAPFLFINANVGKKLGIEAGEGSAFAEIDRFDIEGGLSLKKVKCLVETPFQIEGMNGMGMAGMELHGIMGFTLLAKFRMDIDLTQSKMVWTPVDYHPVFPTGKRGAGGTGLDFLGPIYRIMGSILGAKATPDMAPRGFVGVAFKAEKKTVSIAAVLGKSPAAEAGLKIGDQVVEINGQTVEGVDDVQRITSQKTAGQRLEFLIQRGSEKLKIGVAAGDGL